MSDWVDVLFEEAAKKAEDERALKKLKKARAEIKKMKPPKMIVHKGPILGQPVCGANILDATWFKRDDTRPFKWCPKCIEIYRRMGKRPEEP